MLWCWNGGGGSGPSASPPSSARAAARELVRRMRAARSGLLEEPPDRGSAFASSVNWARRTLSLARLCIARTAGDCSFPRPRPLVRLRQKKPTRSSSSRPAPAPPMTMTIGMVEDALPMSSMANAVPPALTGNVGGGQMHKGARSLQSAPAPAALERPEGPAQALP